MSDQCFVSIVTVTSTSDHGLASTVTQQLAASDLCHNNGNGSETRYPSLAMVLSVSRSGPKADIKDIFDSRGEEVRWAWPRLSKHMISELSLHVTRGGERFLRPSSSILLLRRSSIFPVELALSFLSPEYNCGESFLGNMIPFLRCLSACPGADTWAPWSCISTSVSEEVLCLKNVSLSWLDVLGATVVNNMPSSKSSCLLGASSPSSSSSFSSSSSEEEEYDVDRLILRFLKLLNSV